MIFVHAKFGECEKDKVREVILKRRGVLKVKCKSCLHVYGSCSCSTSSNSMSSYPPINGS